MFHLCGVLRKLKQSSKCMYVLDMKLTRALFPLCFHRALTGSLLIMTSFYVLFFWFSVPRLDHESRQLFNNPTSNVCKCALN